MTFWDFLLSVEGLQLEHAVIVLLLAIAGYLSWLTKKTAADNRKLLNGHLAEHMKEAEAKNGETH